MKSSLVKRMLTAVILAPIFIWSIFNIPKEYFSYFLLLFVALGCWEFSRLINIRNLILRATYSLFVVVVVVVDVVVDVYVVVVVVVVGGGGGGCGSVVVGGVVVGCCCW